MKKAFTLIEMLVVVGIIAVLASIVLVNIRGATEAANATKCISNMRSLCNAMNAVGMDWGLYPLAGPVTATTTGLGENTTEGWISRDRSGNVVPCYGTGNADDDIYALTNGCAGGWQEGKGDSNGTFWQAVAQNASIFCCPTFAQDLLAKRKRKPVFSYALNAAIFKSDLEDQNYQSLSGPGMAHYNNKGDMTDKGDKRVMFAELPISQSCSYDPLSKPDTCNAALQIKMTFSGIVYGNPLWKGRSEAIGFVHLDKRKKYYGHVAFIDGHVEKFMQPPASSSLKEDALTARICIGDDVAYDEKGYRFVAEAEDEED